MQRDQELHVQTNQTNQTNPVYAVQGVPPTSSKGLPAVTQPDTAAPLRPFDVGTQRQ